MVKNSLYLEVKITDRVYPSAFDAPQASGVLLVYKKKFNTWKRLDKPTQLNLLKPQKNHLFNRKRTIIF